MASNSLCRPLKKRSDFERLRLDGDRCGVAYLVANFSPNSDGQLRIGWTIPRKVGSAVIRNRLRRWGREFFKCRQNTQQLTLDINIVLKPRAGAMYKSLTHREFDESLRKLVHAIQRHVRKSRQ